ncbi:MAG: type III-A CRISPR-associated RAMP protein Csm3 [Candidatus Firestonebacteria bacterium]|nr:type III-A CRISPR-associated RAMP protein Csm3 [Candidatus Firestonebacteria bacterium]
MKLIGYKNINGIIEIVTGLHIGGSTSMIEIGGKDNPIIKHPLTKEPYIPGSSLKGKMRSLLEWNLGKLDTKPQSKDFGEVHKWCNDSTCPICLIFGTSADEAGIGPTRLIIRDAVLNKEFKDKQIEKDSTWTVLNLTEDKYENTINRITARANPRNFERVISGTEFSFSMSYRVFENINPSNGNSECLDETLFKHVIDGLKLLENDALGGAGSRGCGQIKFKIKINGGYKTLDELNIVNDFPTVG